LPFAFAAHFAPDLLIPALELYRSRFKPSAQLAEPYTLVCTNVYAADTDREARLLFTSLEQAFSALRSGRPVPLPPPLLEVPPETDGVPDLFRYAIVGDREAVREGLEEFLAFTGANELMATAMIYDHRARLRSFEILAEVRDSL